MKILIHGINYSPELTGIGKYSGEMAEWLAAQGHEVRVVTAPPYYPQWKVAAGYSAGWYRTEKIHRFEAENNPSACAKTPPFAKGGLGGDLEVRQGKSEQQIPLSPPLIKGETGGCLDSPFCELGKKPPIPAYPTSKGGKRAFFDSALSKGKMRCGSLLVYRCPVWVPAKPSGLKRLLHLASFALSSLPVMLRQVFWRPDVVWVVEPALFCAPQAWLVARLSGARCWLHIQDFEVDAAFDLGILKSDRLKRFVLSLESWLMRRFDVVSTISPNMHKRLMVKGVDPSRAVLFPNWVDGDEIYPLAGGSVMRAELGIAADTVVLLYSGNMGEKQGLEIVLDAARRLMANCNIRFVLCGEGAVKARLMQTYSDLPNVSWLPLQPLERLNDLLNLADIHLLPQRADAADLVMPSKLTGMLASGRPVIATAHANTQVAEVVQACGAFVAPGDVSGFVDAILALAGDVEKCMRLGEMARRYAVEKMSKVAVLEAFERELMILKKEKISDD